MILDRIHVFEKLWKTAQVFHEGGLEADLWGMDRALRILFGEVGQAVKGIRQSVTKLGLSGAKSKMLNAAAANLQQNLERMRYDEYLANGWPIASGPDEGDCKNLIKDGMERSGMRLIEPMAVAIRPTQSDLPLETLQTLLAVPNRTGSTTDLCRHLERRSQVATPPW